MENYAELIEQLRNTQSRSKRRLLDAAADAISELLAQLPEWLDPEVEVPLDCELILVEVSGKPRSNITFDHAIQLAEYSDTDKWIVDEYPEWEGAVVHRWMRIPEVNV